MLAIGMVTLSKIEGDQGLVEEAIQSYLDHFYTFIEEDIKVKETLAQLKVEDLNVVALIFFKSEQLRKMNPEKKEDPQYLKVNLETSMRKCSRSRVFLLRL